MKKINKILAFILTLFILAGSAVYAADTDKVSVSIVSPADKSVSVSDSLVISVKINNPGKIRVGVYEQCIKTTEILSTGSALKGTFATYASVKYDSVDTSAYTAASLTSNPALATYVSRTYKAPVVYDSTEKIGFYTDSISNVKPGIYKLVVEVLGEKGEVVSTISSTIALKAKPVEEDSTVFESTSTTFKLFQTILNKLFGNAK